MTNRVEGEPGNSVVVYVRDATDGTLERVGLFDTGGLGGNAQLPTDALGSQDSLIVSENKICVLASNAGSDTITSFQILDGYLLHRVGIYPSSGSFPVSLTQHGSAVYVLNSGGQTNISGFHFDELTCILVPVAGSTIDLPSVQENPPIFLFSPVQIAFTSNGRGLLVSLKEQNALVYFAVDETNNGLVVKQEPSIVNDSNGILPFGFDFVGDSLLLVVEVAGALDGTNGRGAVSSYRISNDGTLSVISPSVPTMIGGSCWLKYDANNEHAYVTSNGSEDTVSILASTRKPAM